MKVTEMLGYWKYISQLFVLLTTLLSKSINLKKCKNIDIDIDEHLTPAFKNN